MNPVARPRPALASVPEQIAREIDAAIIRGDYAPGESLREIPLAEFFGVSRSSVREAMRLLERDGVIVIEPRRGARVSKLTAAEMVEVYQIRAVLFGLAARLFAERRPDADVAAMRSRFAELQSLASKPDETAAPVHRELSAQMAETLAAGCGNVRLGRLVRQMALQIARYTALGLSSARRRRESVRNWARLIDAIAAKDVEASESAARRLIGDTQAFALAQLAAPGAPEGAPARPGTRRR